LSQQITKTAFESFVKLKSITPHGIIIVSLNIFVDIVDVFIVKLELVIHVHVCVIQVHAELGLLEFAAEVFANHTEVVGTLRYFVCTFKLTINIEIKVEFIVEVVKHNLFVETE